MEPRYQSGVLKACQWLSFSSHQMFELSIEIALCDDKKENTDPVFKVVENELTVTGTIQNPYAEELNQLAVKIREKVDFLITINRLDPFRVESWDQLDIFDVDMPAPAHRKAYHDLVRFCYQLLTDIPRELMKIIDPGLQVLREHSKDGRLYSEEDVLYEKTSNILIHILDDFKEAQSGFVMARYLAKNEGRII